MKTRRRLLTQAGCLLIPGILLLHGVASAQQEPGHSLGKVTVQGDLIVMTLDQGVLGKANLFNLDHHTLHFTPEGAGYRAENLPLQWDAEFGAETGAQVTLKKFAFPFSG